MEQSTKTSLHRSQTYQNLFDDQYMMETFGTLRPDVTARTNYYFELWTLWRVNRVKLKRGSSATDARTDLKSLGLKELRDFQIRNGEIRFAETEILAMAKMGGIDKYLTT